MSDIVHRSGNEMVQPEGNRDMPQALDANAGDPPLYFAWLTNVPAHKNRVMEMPGGYVAYTTKPIDRAREESATDLVAVVKPTKDAELTKMLGDKMMPAFALPLDIWSGSASVERELTKLYKRDRKRFLSLFEGSRNLSLAILKEPGGLKWLSEADRIAFDELQLGLRAMAKVAVYQNAQHNSYVKEPLQPLLSARGKQMIEKGKQDMRYAAVVRDPDGVIQTGRKDEFTKRLTENRFSQWLKNTKKRIAFEFNSKRYSFHMSLQSDTERTRKVKDEADGGRH